MTRPAYDRASDPRLVIVGTTAGQISWTLTHSPGARAHYDRPCLGDDRRTSQKRLVLPVWEPGLSRGCCVLFSRWFPIGAGSRRVPARSQDLVVGQSPSGAGLDAGRSDGYRCDRERLRSFSESWAAAFGLSSTCGGACGRPALPRSTAPCLGVLGRRHDD